MLITFTPIIKPPKMEEEGEEEEKEEERRQLVSETNEYPKDRSATSSFIWRGLRLGKKVALAGAAISTAPVVIPPLIVGLAFAFPFGVYIAGFTYTNKVMRALLSTPPDLVMPDGRDEEEEEEEEEDIEIWPPTATLLIDHSLAAVKRTGNDLGIETSARQMIVFSGDDEVPGGMVEGGEAKKEAASTEKGHDEVDGDELAPVTAEHDIDRKEDMLRDDITTLGEERQMQIERGAEKNEDERRQPEEKEIQGLASAVPKAKNYQKNTPAAVLMPKESDNEMINRTMFSSKYAPAVENGKEMAVYEVKEQEMMFYGRAEGIEENATPPHKTMELVHCSLAAVPEEREVDFKLPSLNTEHALSASGGGTEAVVDGKIMKGVGTKEMNGTDEVEMNKQDGMEQIESNYVVATVECKHVVEQSAVDRNRIERGVETLGQTVESEKDEGGVMGERNTGNGRSVATPEENVIDIYHSFVSVAPLESESESERVPSSLTSEYASAVEDQSTGMTDNVSGPTAIIVETAGVVNFDNEVLYSEEMIWEQIYAMRTIVGYKSALNSSLVEELKALYLFTGVEPPISLRDTSDVMEIGDKLDFLKSVIGVK